MSKVLDIEEDNIFSASRLQMVGQNPSIGIKLASSNRA